MPPDLGYQAIGGAGGAAIRADGATLLPIPQRVAKRGMPGGEYRLDASPESLVAHAGSAIAGPSDPAAGPQPGTRPKSTRPGRSGLTCGPKIEVFMLYGRSALREDWK